MVVGAVSVVGAQVIFLQNHLGIGSDHFGDISFFGDFC